MLHHRLCKVNKYCQPVKYSFKGVLWGTTFLHFSCLIKQEDILQCTPVIKKKTDHKFTFQCNIQWMMEASGGESMACMLNWAHAGPFLLAPEPRFVFLSVQVKPLHYLQPLRAIHTYSYMLT